MKLSKVSRRTILKSASALPLITMPTVWSSDLRAQNNRLTVRDPGGAWREALTKAYYAPFEKETGIRINPVLADHDPTALVKTQVDTKNYIWDVTIMTIAAQAVLPSETYFEPLDMSHDDVKELIPQARQERWMGNSVYAQVLAYNTEKYGKNPPKSWADFWDVKNFPGRRGMRRHAIDTFEQALLASGVPNDKLFPMDIDRALKSLDQIKPHINVWWTGYAQSAQLLASNEIDMGPVPNARGQAVIDEGGKYAFCWNQGIWGIDGWCVLKGAPNAKAGREFVRFAANAQRQAVFAQHLAYAPVNPKAFQHLSADRAKILPTNPEYFPNLVYQDPIGWGPQKDEALQRFESWIVK